jgi:P-type conjugative transfer protein TrbJ
MLQNMALNLKRLDYSSLTSMTSALQQVESLMLQGQGIAFDVTRTDVAFRNDYPDEYAAAVTADKLVRDARARWRNSMHAYRQTLGVQAQVVQNVQADGQLLSSLVTASQGAEGHLQAQQATNQLLALSTKQHLQIQNMMAAQYRAEALEQARAAEAQEQSRAAFQKFLGSGSAYKPR